MKKKKNFLLLLQLSNFSYDLLVSQPRNIEWHCCNTRVAKLLNGYPQDPRSLSQEHQSLATFVEPPLKGQYFFTSEDNQLTGLKEKGNSWECIFERMEHSRASRKALDSRFMEKSVKKVPARTPVARCVQKYIDKGRLVLSVRN